jgi:hypothetical protein
MPDPAEGTSKHLRIGGMSKVLLYNRESDDATLPELSPAGIASSVGLPANTWKCFEYHIGADGTIETWLDGTSIAGMTYGPKITNANAAAWGRSTIIPKPTGVYFGWESYASDANTFWYDDVAIAASRVGCGAGTVSSATSATSATSAASSTKTTMVTSTTKASSSSSTSSTTKASSSSTSTSTTKTSTSSTTSATGCTATHWGQCAGIGYTGCTVCESPYTCKYSNDWYSQCL